MATAAIGKYEFESKNDEKHYGGDFQFYIKWDDHLLHACPSAYRAPWAMTLRDFMEQMYKPDHMAHPDTAQLDIDKIQWRRDQQPWSPDLDKSFKDNGMEHMDFLEFSAPGLVGMHGAGN